MLQNIGVALQTRRVQNWIMTDVDPRELAHAQAAADLHHAQHPRCWGAPQTYLLRSLLYIKALISANPHHLTSPPFASGEIKLGCDMPVKAITWNEIFKRGIMQ